MNHLDIDFSPLAGHPHAQLAMIDSNALITACSLAKTRGDRLISLWASDNTDQGSGYSLHVALESADGLLVLCTPLPAENPEYPDLGQYFHTAPRLQRAVADLLGIKTTPGATVDHRPWLRHCAWPEDYFPLGKKAQSRPEFPAACENYAFVRVEGDGVHEIPVGPVHAGIIEPGHFRFSVVGERVLRLEERLGYTHKGIEKRFESFKALDGHRLAARISGDSAVAFSWAYCQAIEGLFKIQPSSRSIALRALALERERLANHLGDLGALGNDAGFAFGLTHFMRLKEDLLRENATVFGARYLMDYVIPGGVSGNLNDAQMQSLAQNTHKIAREVQEMRNIYDNHPGVQDRFMAAGRISLDLARQLGTTGLAGRASGIDRDLRRDHPWPPYDTLQPSIATSIDGDVASRVNIRFDEIIESLRLIQTLALTLPDTPITTEPPASATAGLGIGWIEGWRGPVLIALETDTLGNIRRCHAHDPSWHNWPTLEHAVMDNIVPDFPLINKSFNLSYSGHDL